MGHRSLLTALLQRYSGFQCKSSMVVKQNPVPKIVHFWYGSSASQGRAFKHETRREKILKARENYEDEVKEAQPISPPQLLKVTGATAERCLIFFSEGKTQREREKEREGGREVEDTNKKSIWHMTVARNLLSAKSVTATLKVQRSACEHRAQSRMFESTPHM